MMRAAATLAVIPARYASSRFEGKPLFPLCGKPMIQHVYERVSRAKAIDAVVVATDDRRILEAVEAFGGQALMTRADAPTGTDRIAEVAERSSAKVIVNVQGDEPLVLPEMVDALARCLKNAPEVPMASLMVPLSDPRRFEDPNVVKVVVDREGFALYFSRAPIPFERDSHSGQALGAHCYQHVGLYGFQRDFLLRFPHLPPTPLAELEKLEQLKALEHGYRIRMLETDAQLVGVDRPEDAAAAEAILRGEGGCNT